MSKSFTIDEKAARRFMERAIEEMKKSVHEPRDDGKVAPLVGAVLVRPDGTVDTAYRGELRHGDHAEYTLLERKNRNVKLDGSFLFVTLEPCAESARKHPKLCCAERIVLARIKKVWIGIEDPDPKVDGMGRRYLEDNDVDVGIFDRDLQDEIKDINKEFIAGALERAEDQDVQQRIDPLKRPDHVTLEHLLPEAVEQYRDRIEPHEPIDSPTFLSRLVRQGLLEKVDDGFKPTGYGALLFGENPRDVMHQVGLLATIHREDGSEDVKDFDGPQVLVPDQALAWLHDKVATPISRTNARRTLAHEQLFTLIREGIVNALVHRDYDIRQAKCQLLVTSDYVEIWSPGKPMEPITIEQMQSFNAPMLSRNPILHYVFARMEMAEERGLGLKSMRADADHLQLPLPTYYWHDPYLVLRILWSREAASTVLGPILDSLNTAQKNGWEWLSRQDGTTSGAYAKALGVTDRTALNHLKEFVKLGLLRRTGTGPKTIYRRVR